MRYIGPHVHTTGGVHNAPLNAKAIGATAFGLFTKNQRRWVAKPLESSVVDSFLRNMEQCGFNPAHVLPHDSYLINIGNPDTLLRQQSIDALLDEVERCRILGLPWLNIHPGSHVSASSEQQCLSLIGESINRILDVSKSVGIVLETTAGQGTNVGYCFEHLAYIINEVEDKSRIGVCMDTCHIFAAGYNIRDSASYNDTMKLFDETVGLGYLRAMHLNDAKSSFASRVDRHESIGKGNLGLEPFRLIMQDCRFGDIPYILETIDEELWPGEIALLSEMAVSNADT